MTSLTSMPKVKCNIKQLKSKRKRVDSDESDDDDYVSSDPITTITTRISKNNASPPPPKSNSTTMPTYPLRIHASSQHILSRKTTRQLRVSLLKWYEVEHAKRGMPWRRKFHEPLSTDATERAQNAYQVWISEIMCQQTQVGTVIPYYERWMEKFPTIHALALADIETVNSIWKGLGYYSRAKRLLEGAKKVVDEFEGRLPEDPQVLEKSVPGIGRYSSGAITSIAYGVRAPVLDGNVTRLLSRLLALHASSKSKATLDILWDGAKAFVDDEDCVFPGDVNQGLIELGSTICRVKDPKCEECPLRSGCVAFGETRAQAKEVDVPDIEDACTLCSPHVHPPSLGVTRYPMKVEKKKAREETDLILALEHRDKLTKERWLLLEKRPNEGTDHGRRDCIVFVNMIRTGLLGGLWNFPNLACVDSGSSKTDLEGMVPGILEDCLEDPPRVDMKDLKRLKQPTKGALSRYFVAPPKKKEEDSTHDEPSEDDGDGPKVTRLEHAEDVLHIFSHIRKTYRAIWIVVEGGVGLPIVRETTGGTREANTATKKKKAKTDDEIETAVVERKWIKAEDVANANIGTGMMKIWKNVCGLYDGKVFKPEIKSRGKKRKVEKD